MLTALKNKKGLENQAFFICELFAQTLFDTS
jgi:hypothetical protein